MKTQQPKISLYTSKEFGELHATISPQGKVYYCATDLCRNLNLLIREGEKIIKTSKCSTKEFLVKKTKKTISYVFVDYDGLISLLIESRKTKANAYRKWIEHAIGKPQKKKGITQAQQEQLQPINGMVKGDDGDYPTLDKYFREYVPSSYLIDTLFDTMKDYLLKAEQSNCSNMDEVLHRIEILHTFNSTLIANNRNKVIA